MTLDFSTPRPLLAWRQIYSLHAFTAAVYSSVAIYSWKYHFCSSAFLQVPWFHTVLHFWVCVPSFPPLWRCFSDSDNRCLVSFLSGKVLNHLLAFFFATLNAWTDVLGIGGRENCFHCDTKRWQDWKKKIKWKGVKGQWCVFGSNFH